ncbi:MAG: DnaD domain protein [Ruthenibacterium sp.]
MPYRLIANCGDSISVPQLLFTKLPDAEDDWVRVALFVIATGEADPARIAAALRLKTPDKAKEALLFWKGAGLLESVDAAPAESTPITAARTCLTTPEVTSAAKGDPAIASLVQECQQLLGGVMSQADTNIFVSMYLTDGMPIDMILLGVSYFASLGKRSARYVERALLGWQRDGIDSGEAVERYLAQLALRESREKHIAELFHLPDAKFTKSERNAIADWHENFGFDDAMIAEALAYAGEKNNVRYVNGILRAWHTKGYHTVRDVMAESAATMQNVQVTNPNASTQTVLHGGLKRAPTFQKAESE